MTQSASSRRQLPNVSRGRPVLVRTSISAFALLGVLAVTSLIRAQHAPAASASRPVRSPTAPRCCRHGWRLTPAGRHLAVGDLPLNAVQSPDARYLIVTNNGLAKPSLTVIDIASWTVKSTTTVDSAWLRARVACRAARGCT